jgi:hypothetical protein
VLIAVLGLALCAAAFLATRGAKDPDGAITASPTPAPAASAPKSKSGAAADKAHKAQSNKHEAAAPQEAKPAKHEAAAEQDATKAGSADKAPTKAHRQAAKPEHAKPADPRETAIAVTKALGKGDAVVFFFTHHGAADDQRTRQAVATLRGHKHVMIVQAGLEQLADYRPVLAGAGVSQVPSIVIVHADKPARLLEGYVDRGTLRQNVADALR